MRSPDLIKKRNQAIREEYKKLISERKWHVEYIQKQLSEKYYLSLITIQKICYSRKEE